MRQKKAASAADFLPPVAARSARMAEFVAAVQAATSYPVEALGVATVEYVQEYQAYVLVQNDYLGITVYYLGPAIDVSTPEPTQGALGTWSYRLVDGPRPIVSAFAIVDHRHPITGDDAYWAGRAREEAEEQFRRAPLGKRRPGQGFCPYFDRG